ncbi:Catenin-beta-like protein [Trametes maxima]|nr:Catenin-beta-like protein [Trametes maxima]
MDIDKLFKVPKLPAGGNKRRMPDNPTPEMLKRMRMDDDESVSEAGVVDLSGSASRDKGKSRAVTVEDEDEEGQAMETDFAPGGDADYFAEEDDEGRFFGGGLTQEQKDILNIFDRAGGEEAREDLEEMNAVTARRLLTRFERAANKNQDQRSKYPDDPTKFIDSEADLDAALKALLPLAQSPIIAYPEIIRGGTVERLIGLLSHENVDIVIDVVEVVHEFTDEDVGNEADEDEEETDGSREDALKQLIQSFLDNAILELLVDNLSRFNEEEESDRQGIFHVLGIFENLLGFNAELSTQLVSKTKILSWLLKRIESPKHDENRGYAAEILSILLQNNRSNRLALGKQDGVESLLKILSRYRKRDPVDADETEFMENVFDVLCSALGEPEVKQQFLDSEGVDLMVLMMKDKMQARSRAIKALDYAMSGPAGTAACETFVEALGLKTLFSSFMGGKTSKKQKAAAAGHAASEDTAHTLGIVSSLLSNLASDSPARIRLLAKFVENNYEKPEKLLEIRDAAQGRLKVTEKEIEDEKKRMHDEGEEVEPDMEDLWYLRRLDGGLFTLQTVDYILAWIVMEDDGVRSHIQKLLDRKSQSFKDIVEVLQIYHDNVDEDTTEANPDGAPSQREILRSLIAILNAC